MRWIYLLLAALFEAFGTSLLKMSDGFTHLWPSLGSLVAFGCMFLFFSFALKKIEMGVAYAIWGSVGTFVIATVGILAFHESIAISKLIYILLIVIGTLGLKMSHDS